MERVWDFISGKIDGWFHQKKLRRYFRVANVIKERVKLFLLSRNIDYEIEVADSSEHDWPKVEVRVHIKHLSYEEIFDLWEETHFVYEGLESEDTIGVFLHFDPYHFKR